MSMTETTTPGLKKAYVKPQLATHGTVQKLTEGGHGVSCEPKEHECGSHIRFPKHGGHCGKDGWEW